MQKLKNTHLSREGHHQYLSGLQFALCCHIWYKPFWSAITDTLTIRIALRNIHGTRQAYANPEMLLQFQ